MNIARVPITSLKPFTGRYWRKVASRYVGAPLATAHTRVTPGRFNDGTSAIPKFEILYLAETNFVADLEVGALLGSPWHASALIRRTGASFINVQVSLNLQFVADLSDIAEQGIVRSNVQELTGDWPGYRYRSLPGFSVTGPTGVAETQQLGQALYSKAHCEGFLYTSAKAPGYHCLAIFPQKLSRGSNISCTVNGVYHSLPIP